MIVCHSVCVLVCVGARSNPHSLASKPSPLPEYCTKRKDSTHLGHLALPSGALAGGFRPRLLPCSLPADTPPETTGLQDTTEQTGAAQPGFQINFSFPS